MFANLRYFLLPVLNITGPVLIAFACLLLLPVFVSSLYNDGAAYGFEIAFVLCLITGLTLYVFTKRHRRELLPRDGFLLATIIWAVTPLFGAIPLMLEIPGISFTHAYFESMSGITTTCATVLSGLSELPESINFWRCMMSWLGGMGILVLAVAILPMLGVGGSQIFRAEFSGPMKESRLTPRIADTAKGLWGIYIALSLACFISYRLAGMNTYESIIHMFTTVSLGGFSSYDESFAHWNNPNIEAVAIVFMLLCGVSFSLHFFAWKKRSIVAYFKNVECLSWLSIAALTTACATGLLLMSDTSLEPLHALRLAAFNVISVISTTGYASQDFAQWPASIYILMFVVLVISLAAGGYLLVETRTGQTEKDLEQAPGPAMTQEQRLKLYAEYCSLTPRETEVLEKLLTTEDGVQEIADSLYLSRRMLQRHISSIYEKTETKSRIGLFKSFTGFWEEYR